MTTLLLTHSCFVDHDTGPGHPERPDRMRAIDAVLKHEMFADLVRDEAPLREDVEAAIALAHSHDYIDQIKRVRPGPGQEPVRLDPDTVLSPKSWEPALRSVSSGLDAIDRVLDPDNDIKNAFCQVRPCGHHAEKDRAMGFCFFSNVAIAAKYAQQKHGLERVAVIDFDVHHGNGTQDVFWGEKDLFLASTHQFPLYPGTGDWGETGEHNNICNVPLNANEGSETFREAIGDRVLPALEAFRPDLVLISAGFDAHEADPLANLRLREPDYAWVTLEIMGVADRMCGGRVVSMLEGGYDLKALAGSTAAHVRALMTA